MTTIRDVAAHAQVSIGTVSRVINNHPSVRPITRRVVMASIKELNFQPNAVARAFRTSRTRTLAVVISGMRHPLAGAAVWGAETVARECGYALLIADSHNDPAIEAQVITSLLERQIDGLVCAPAHSSARLHDLLQPNRVPLVVLGKNGPDDLFPAAVAYETSATVQAIEHLIELGHQDMGVVSDDSRSGLERAQDIRRTMRESSLSSLHVLYRSAKSPSECVAAVCKLLTQNRRPTTLLITTLTLIPSVLEGVAAAGMHIPDDVSLIAFGDTEWARALNPPLSVIAYDTTAHLAAATRLLIGLMEQQPDLPWTVEQNARYIRRASVQPPRQ